uniref:Uncharacterized protein n=1 Tax=Glossina austeni TaxID=7395 RepID=A0A1A9VX29_GLOAU
MYYYAARKYWTLSSNTCSITAAYAPLWTNIAGVLINSEKPASNSPVEGYFSVVKNITLDGQRNIRPTEYVREPYNYIKAKPQEIKSQYVEGKVFYGTQPKNKEVLVEEKWLHTPKKHKNAKHAQIMLSEKIFKRCQEGDLLLFGDNIHVKEKLKQVLLCKVIIVPILHNRHFTFAYINSAPNTFTYVDPIGNEEATLSQLFEKYKTIHNNNNLWIAKTEVHDLQNIKKDITNCEVFVCQFLERIAKHELLIHLTHPSDYRKRMKQKMFTI